jgi:autotransporter translocation and assembly factor TamB
MRVRADVDLRATGEIQGPSLTGTVVVRNTEYTRDTALLSVGGPAAVETPGFQLFQVPGEFARNTSISLSVRGNESIEVHNNLFQGAVSTDLELGGTLAVPVPAGRVSTEDSVLLLPLTTIDIEQAQLRFPRSNPFEPTISGRGSARIRGHDLRVIASGTLPDVEVEVSSDPPLPQDEALILLTTGRTPDSLAESGASLGTLLGEQLIRNLTGPRQEGGLQQVDVRIGENISPEGVESLEVGFNLGEEDRWYLVFKRSQEERYSLDLAWRFWFQ